MLIRGVNERSMSVDKRGETMYNRGIEMSRARASRLRLGKDER